MLKLKNEVATDGALLVVVVVVVVGVAVTLRASDVQPVLPAEHTVICADPTLIPVMYNALPEIPAWKIVFDAVRRT